MRGESAMSSAKTAEEAKVGASSAFGQRQIRGVDGGGDVVPGLVLLFAPGDGQVAADD